ncbi:MAG: DUF362 domain-containing protein [Bacteroidales bacterium]|nr:DUF362 domain-containing protein [Bacteroidales bacterium]
MAHQKITRRKMIKNTTAATVGGALFLNSLPGIWGSSSEKKTRVVLIRDERIPDYGTDPDQDVVQEMLDRAVIELTGATNINEAWEKIIRPDDIVGIKTNAWKYLPTPKEVENGLKKRILKTGVAENNIAISDRGVRNMPVFQKATALINTRPMRTHAWSGVGSLLKNQIMFAERPSAYHDDACADLATLWELPQIKGKTRLNVLVMFTPLFHGVGPHHFNKEYVWSYKGLVVSFDPVAADSVGLQIIQARRREYFGEDRPLSPHAKHIEYAETRHRLGVADPARIELVRLGYKEGMLI